ncbi:8888_t:CDS:2 [Acaulospora morrowiae]|uniref:8888_t:CDS:1 n=1 Tax=Acaulospora morrowiae TaxID=94023 RepID=A0A9N8WSL1_9GLOM|nr:8888_t:CDS:2 [Acaulospora morrowiae]
MSLTSHFVYETRIQRVDLHINENHSLQSAPTKIIKKQNNSQGIDAEQAGENPSRRVTSPPPDLVLPFPPQVNAKDLMDCKTRQLPSKPPNAFFIYRKVYTKELIAQNLRFKMTDVSPWVSMSWRRESEEVKIKYKEIAKEVRQIYKQAKQNNIKDTEMLSNEIIAFTQFGNSPFPSPPLTDSLSSTPELSRDFYQFGQTFQSDLQAALEGSEIDFFDCSPVDYFQMSNPLGFTTFQPQDVAATLWQADDSCNKVSSTGMVETANSIIPQADYTELMHQDLNDYLQFNTVPQFDAEQIWNFQENLDFLFDNMNQTQWGIDINQ